MTKPRTRRSPISLAEYLALEEASPERHEYLVGEVYMMTGASTRHNLISSNILRHLHGPARQRGCRVFIEGVKVRAATNVIYYPDVMVACGRASDEDLVVENPSIVVEVASPSTRATDRREKLANYRAIASLQTYLIVEQKRRQVICYSRVGGEEWERLELFGTGDVALPSLEYTLTLDEIYEDVQLPPMKVGEQQDEDDELEEDDDAY